MKLPTVELRIIEFIKQNNLSPTATTDQEIATGLILDLIEVQDYLHLLKDKGLLQLADSYDGTGAWLTPLGRTILRDPTYDETKYSGQVVNILTVIDSKIQNLVQAGQSVSINQLTSSTSNQEILALVAKMVEAVSSSNDVSSELKKDYQLEAEALKIEMSKSHLNLHRIRDILAFLGDADGTLGIATRLAPYLVALAPYVQQIISAIHP